MPQPFSSRAQFWLAAAITLVAVLVVFSLLGWTVEWLWLTEVGYPEVFWRVNLTKIGLFVGTFVPLYFFFWLNVRAVITVVLHPDSGAFTWFIAAPVSTWNSSAWIRLIRALAPALGAAFFATSAASQWDTAIRFLHAQDFGQIDPVFGLDVGFYVFSLPLYEALQSMIVALGVIGIGANAVLCHYLGLFRKWASLAEDLRAHVVRTISANGILFVAGWGGGYFLDRYRLLYDAKGIVHGPGYTDVAVTIPALGVMAGASIALIAVLVVGIKTKRYQLPALGVVSYFGLAALALAIVPGLFQYFVVKPTELELEESYLRSNIDFTRQAFGIDKVEERDYPAVTELTYADIAANQDTLRNIRLWDWRPFLQAIRQLQEIRLYYRFYDVDVDRYRLGEGLRQVMISARELSERLPDRAQTWVNRYLQFTHGYGVAMSLAAHESDQGAPTLIAKDLPPVTAKGLEIAQPAIYFGEKTVDYRIVNTAIKELSHPDGDANVYSSYDGKGGILLDSALRRMLFAWNQFDINIVLSSYITPDSRIQIWRSIQERVSRVAPFLLLDRDPYIVVSEGRLRWVQDAYTISKSYPYSEPFRGRFNYIRNPVKIVVDAYDGTVDLYTVDETDPVLKAYRQAFPGLFKPLDSLGADMRAHLRYPPDLFEAQVEMYGTYHMHIPQVFYNKEDLWILSREKYAGETAPMQPYYILMRLPDEAALQFLLMTPMTPSNKDNMISWMAGRGDFPNYGQLVVYKLPKDRLIYGPLQIEALIDQDPAISRQLALWDQRGSRVIRGNLIVVPIGHSLLYVKPVYLVAASNDLPQLQRVIVAYNEKIAMEPSLERSLEVVFGRAPGSAAETAPGEVPTDDGMARAREPFARAQRALQQNDWRGFGAAMDDLRRMIQPDGRAE